MSLPVKLSEVVEQLSMISEDTTAYLNKRTNELVMLPGDSYELEDEESADEEDLDEQPEWLREFIAQRRES